MKPAILLLIGFAFLSVSRDVDFPISYRQHNASIGTILMALGTAEGLERIARRFLK